MRKQAAPIIAAILLLLPALYLGSYLALVVAEAIVRERTWHRARLNTYYQERQRQLEKCLF